MLVQQIKKDRIQAMKDKDTARRATLELVLALLEKEKVALKLATVEDLNKEQTETIIGRYIKALDKEAEAYATAGQSTEKQDKERELLSGYIPKQMTESEIIEAIAPVVHQSANMGEAMKHLSVLKGKANMKRVNELVKEAFKNK
jgi:uncharacterized protein